MYADPVAGVYKKLVLSDDARTLLGGVLVGDARRYAGLRPMVGPGARRGPGGVPAAGGAAAPVQLELPDDAPVCSCNNVAAGTIRCAVTRRGLHRHRRCEGKHQGRDLLRLVPADGQEAGRTPSSRRPASRSARRCASTSRCPAPSCSTSSGCRSSARSARSSSGTAPAAAATSAGRWSPRSWPASDPGPRARRRSARLQDTNDHVMANMQKDGTYSVVPRIPGGEITPEGLIDDRRGGPRLRALHQDHRRPADRPVRRPDRAAAGDLEAAGRRRLRVRSRVRQGAADGEVVRRLAVVPVRRTGLGRAGDRARAALPRAAVAAQAQARRLRLRPRVRRGARQGRRRDRDREGLEPVRRRQRRLHARGTPSCSPRT